MTWATIRIDGRRELAVPAHGRLIVVRRADGAPALSAYDAVGNALAYF